MNSRTSQLTDGRRSMPGLRGPMFQASPKNHSGPGSRKLPRVVNNADLLSAAAAPRTAALSSSFIWVEIFQIFKKNRNGSGGFFLVGIFKIYFTLNLIELVCLDVVDGYQWAVCRITFTQALHTWTLCYGADMKCLSNPFNLFSHIHQVRLELFHKKKCRK